MPLAPRNKGRTCVPLPNGFVDTECHVSEVVKVLVLHWKSEAAWVMLPTLVPVGTCAPSIAPHAHKPRSKLNPGLFSLALPPVRVRPRPPPEWLNLDFRGTASTCSSPTYPRTLSLA